ncbi:Uma2 family endonuclease [Gloeobacter morelensis]|uniref:Uma2 family endonuclease n=1 Tax=Gloeobacter morelensis MG652769 TaxID=2781736 RepID=A0ABY3PN04_9CYAN|nr:Uma2 family endonuclease [Gloeobacter morelensis]UFP95075.1 Uma2 family endonuclease [Gloeobacter morelensis MG652769]
MIQPVASEFPGSPIESFLPPPVDLWSDEPPMESDRHRKQMDLLIRSLECWWQDRQNFYCSGNLTIYYSLTQRKSSDFRGPDFFVVLGCERRERRSWTVWQEGGRLPNVIVEILSASTAAIDRGLKKQIYQDVLRVPEYFWFDPETLEWCGFHLVEGQYEPLEPDGHGRLWSRQLELYLGSHNTQLRFFTPNGQLVLLQEELVALQAEQERQAREQAVQMAEQERQAREQAVQMAEQERQAKEKLARYLRERGIDPDTL